MTRALVTVADDFGLSPAVNEAIEIAARDGILTSASLMVAAPHAADAVRRAHALGVKLKVGLHLVVIEGQAALPHALIPDIVDQAGMFGSDQLRLGVAYAFRPAVRRQLEAEIRAQFEAFRATGLPLDHANAHKHMHLHPVIGALMIRIGREFGLRAIRIPAEPPTPAASFGGHALFHWTRLLKYQARRAGLVTNDRIAGLAHTGHMSRAIVQSLVDALLPGVTEMYFHPATHTDDILRATMPAYEHAAELQSLLQTKIPPQITLTAYSDLS